MSDFDPRPIDERTPTRFGLVLQICVATSAVFWGVPAALIVGFSPMAVVLALATLLVIAVGLHLGARANVHRLRARLTVRELAGRPRPRKRLAARLRRRIRISITADEVDRVFAEVAHAAAPDFADIDADRLADLYLIPQQEGPC